MPSVFEGGGCGAELASWITSGRPQLDMFGYDIRCFLFYQQN